MALNAPVWVGVPDSVPVVWPSVMPGGRPLAVHVRDVPMLPVAVKVMLPVAGYAMENVPVVWNPAGGVTTIVGHGMFVHCTNTFETFAPLIVPVPLVTVQFWPVGWVRTLTL